MEKESDSVILQKQELLKSEIIDKEFDKEKFLDFCTSKKENGDDLASWTYEELKETIEEFIKQSVPQQRIKSIQREEIKDITVDVERITVYKPNDERFIEKEIDCKKLEKSLLNDKQITIAVRNPKLTEGGFFSNSYVTYEVFTDLTGWCLRRRYSDFEWLRNILNKSFPGHLIPPIPSKKSGARRFEEDFVKKRMDFLNRFMNVLCESELYKASEAFVIFLSLDDRAMFETKMKEFNYFQTPQYVEDFKTLNGKLQIVDNEENEKYYSNINNYFNLQTQLYDRVNISLNSFNKNIMNASINLYDISRDFSTLNQLNSKVLMVCDIYLFFERRYYICL